MKAGMYTMTITRKGRGQQQLTRTQKKQRTITNNCQISCHYGKFFGGKMSTSPF